MERRSETGCCFKGQVVNGVGNIAYFGHILSKFFGSFNPRGSDDDDDDDDGGGNEFYKKKEKIL